MFDRDLYKKFARKHGLVVCDSDELGIKTENWGTKKVTYLSATGKRVTNPNELRRFESLGVPPAWRQVHFAEAKDFHIQAVGVDQAGRRQYRYHPGWVEVRNEVKTLRLKETGKGLPELRRQIGRDISLKDHSLQCVTASAVRLIDNQLIRIGSEQYVENGTAGCATLPNSAFKQTAEGPVLIYTAKGGKRTTLRLRDPELIRQVNELNAMGGPRLFTYRDENDEIQFLRASQINNYLSVASGKNITAKDFRTFKASAYCLQLLCDEDFLPKKKPKSRISAAIRQVSERLRNTPAVCRSSYVSPRIIDAATEGLLESRLIKGRLRDGLTRSETALMRFMNV